MSAKEPIIVNTEVARLIIDNGYTMNQAIGEVYAEEIENRRKNCENSFIAKNFSPMDFAFYDAKLSRNSSTVKDIIDSATKTYTTQGNGAESLLFPVWQDNRIRESIAGMDIMRLAVASDPIGVNGGVTKGFAIDPRSAENAKELTKVRIAELADAPISKITGSEVTIDLYKIGSAVETSYEAARRMKIRLYEQTLDYLARDIVGQELGWVAATLIEGSGNNDAAVELATTTTANVITNEELSKACLDYYYANNIAPTTLIVGKEMSYSLADMTFNGFDKPGVANRISLNIPQLGAISVTVLLVPNLPKVGGKNVGILYDNVRTINKYVENGSNISETQSNIVNQKNIAVATENVGFGIFLRGSNMLIKSK